MNIPENMKAIAPLLYSEWKAGCAKDEVIGEWAEDGSTYVVKAPYQLVPFIIRMQNCLYHQAKKYHNFMGWANQINDAFKDTFK